MKNFCFFALSLALAISGLSAADQKEDHDSSAKWKIDPVHSQVDFTVRHMMVTNVRGSFNEFSGRFSGLEDGYENVEGKVTIDVSSIDTRNERRDEHLRTADFFSVDQYPEITFELKEIRPQGDGKIEAVGDLSMHGETKEVTFTGEVTEPITDMSGKVRRGVAVSTEISRSDFGLTWNKALESGGVVVGDTVRLSADFSLVKEE